MTPGGPGGPLSPFGPASPRSPYVVDGLDFGGVVRVVQVMTLTGIPGCPGLPLRPSPPYVGARKATHVSKFARQRHELTLGPGGPWSPGGPGMSWCVDGFWPCHYCAIQCTAQEGVLK